MEKRLDAGRTERLTIAFSARRGFIAPVRWNGRLGYAGLI